MLTPPLLHFKKSLLVITLLGLSVPSLADAFIGRISGVDCAEYGHLCPLNKFEQHITEERHFVLLTGTKAFHHLSGIKRDTLLRYVSKRVIVMGELDQESNHINVTELQVQQGERLGHYESVWQK